MRSLREDLREQGLDLVETHISWVFIGPTDVWKVKKPVDLGFLDFSTLERRRAACDDEVRLNRRLAPHVYRGVVPIVIDEGGRHRIGGSDREAVEWAVHMVRLPDDQRADRLLESGAVNATDIENLADEIAAFHASLGADEEAARFGSVAVIGGNLAENFEQTRDTISDYLRSEEAREIVAWQKAFLTRRRADFERRQKDGRIRDGHGDLRLEHCYRDAAGKFTIVDCIEFNRRFRFADVCADLAFLAMDLEWHARVDLAERLLARYAQTAEDYDIYPLIDFYASYRAFVRAKVSSMLAADPQVGTDTRERAASEARRYYLLALASARRSLQQPLVLAVGGIIAAGKSTVARQLGNELEAPVIQADRTRKALLGLESQTSIQDGAWQGAYSPEFSQEVYAEVFRRAESVLSSGRSVILDASFRSRELRRAAQHLADRRGVPFVFVECRCDPELCRERLTRRDRDSSVSDGRNEIFDAFLARWEPVTELAPAQHRVVNTSLPLDQNMTRLSRTLPFWPHGLTA